jgi:site-specific DNA-methyltransferase (adenine-specific)
LAKEEWITFFSSHWNFNGAKQDRHMAVFPEELPRRLIKMFSFPGEIVLDPFLGSGTTSLVAKNLGRNSVGYEINPDYIDICKETLHVKKQDTQAAEFSFEQDVPLIDANALISELPYQFFDPHRMDKKIDIKKVQFGSKIDKNSTNREDYYTVKKIIKPDLLELNNGLIIKLLGITEKPSINHKATTYLEEKIQ